MLKRRRASDGTAMTMATSDLYEEYSLAAATWFHGSLLVFFVLFLEVFVRFCCFVCLLIDGFCFVNTTYIYIYISTYLFMGLIGFHRVST